MANIYRDFFMYHFAFGNMAGGARVTATRYIQADSNFEWCSAAAFVDPYQVAPNITVEVCDMGSGRMLQGEPVPLSALSAVQSYVTAKQKPRGLVLRLRSQKLPIARVFYSKAAITITATNHSGTDFKSVGITLLGAKVFRWDEPRKK